MRQLILLLLGMAGTVAGLPATDALAQPPNIVLIVADDLGWTDLACYGSDLYESPHIDQLARDGMRFTANYSACTVCSPTRAALLTGKYPARLHVTDWIPGLPPSNPKLTVPDFTEHLPLDEITLAERLHDLGYATASIGKWHLGGPEFYPEHHGFDSAQLLLIALLRSSPTLYSACKLCPKRSLSRASTNSFTTSD